MSQFTDITLSSILFHIVLFCLSSLGTGPSFMSISSLVFELTVFFYKALTRNPEIANIPVWVLPNIWRLGLVRDTKFGTDVSNEMLLNAAKCQDYSSYRCWVIKGKPTWKGGGGDKITPHPFHIRVTIEVSCENCKSSVIDVWIGSKYFSVQC